MTDQKTEKPKSDKNWSFWKKLVIFHLIPLGLFVGLLIGGCAWACVEDMHSAPRIINGQSDDASMRASPMLAFFLLAMYLGYVILLCFLRYLFGWGKAATGEKT